MMKKLKSFFRYVSQHKKIVVSVFVVFIVVLFLFLPKQPIPLETYTVKKNHIVQSISVNGSVAAKKSIDLSFPVAGKLVYLGVQKGDNVLAGQVIATLDQRTVQKNLESTLVDYSKQRNTFDQTQDNNANRTPDQALNDQMKRILQNNQYDLNKAIVSVELQSLVKEQSVLVSPIAGIVTRADPKTAGINITTTSIFTVVDPASLVFNMDIDEADVSRVKEGDKVRISLDAYSDNPLDSSIQAIDFVSHTTSTGGNAYTVEVGLQDVSLPYRVGMNGNADIILAERYNSPTIPLSSIFDSNKVYVKTKDGVAVKTVRTGIQSDTDTEVTSGLQDGDVIYSQPSLVPKPSASSGIPIIGRFLKR